MRDGSGTIAAPRQARAGIPAYLDDLTMDLLDKRIAAPESDVLAAELARLDSADDDYEDAGPLRFTQSDPGEPIRPTRRVILGIGALLLVAVIGLFFGIKAITDSSARSNTAQNPTQTGGTNTADPVGGQATDDPQAAPAPEPKKIPLTADQVRIVDPPAGDRDDTGEAKFTVDDDKDTSWDTAGYNQPNFGTRKPGMGVLINLGEPRTVSEIKVEASAPGVTMDIRSGANDPGDNSKGDETIAKTYKSLSDGGPKKTEGDREVFPVADPETKHQYILVWLTELPRGDGGKYRISISNIEVYGS